MQPQTNPDNALCVSWHDSAWIPILDPNNVMDYFAERSNIFYDRQCNNEIIKMQRLSPEHLQNMTGLEYQLVHVQNPILYVIRKQHRSGPHQVTPLQDYYIIAGVVYQAPDLSAVVNSRLLNAIHSLQSAFEEAKSYAQYHPSKGNYWWQFKSQDLAEKEKTKETKKKKEEPSSMFQRQQVDNLLAELSKKYPPKFPGSAHSERTGTESVKIEPKTEVKTEKMDTQSSQSGRPPPEKKAKLMR